MTDTKPEYTHDDVMQAICCALGFGFGAGLAASDVIGGAVSGRPSRWGVAPNDHGGVLTPGGGNVIHLSGPAMRLLAEADAQVVARCKMLDYSYGRSTYDLREIHQASKAE